jgi:hypothetical protein
MNLNSVFQLMVAAGLEQGESLRVTDQIGCDELLRMAGAGLVEISIDGDQAHPPVTLERLTERGSQVLRASAAPLPCAPSMLKKGTIASLNFGRFPVEPRPRIKLAA